MKNINEYKTTSEWFHDARDEGYSLPLAMCHGLDVGQKELGLNFPDIFMLYVKNKVIVKIDKTYTYNLQGHMAI